MRCFRRGVGLQEPSVLHYLEGEGIEHIVGRFARQMFREGAVDDLFAAGAKDVDFDDLYPPRSPMPTP